jgi:hypothetical protein
MHGIYTLHNQYEMNDGNVAKLLCFNGFASSAALANYRFTWYIYQVKPEWFDNEADESP